jgi:hypothetical protein
MGFLFSLPGMPGNAFYREGDALGNRRPRQCMALVVQPLAANEALPRAAIPPDPART